MELWSGPLHLYAKAAKSGSLTGEMLGRFYHYHSYQPSPAETRSWDSSLSALAMVAEKATCKDVGVVLEYHLPLQERRIDAVFLGKNKQDSPKAVIVELKQWSEVGIEDKHALNVLVNGAEYLHPSQQALGYLEYLNEVHSSFVDNKLKGHSCAYCHNLPSAGKNVLNDTRFAGLLQNSPLFFKTEEEPFSQFLDSHLNAGGGVKLLDDFCSGNFKPHKKLLEVLESTIEQEEEWHLLDEQRKAYNTILACIKRLKNKSGRTAVMVRGGPGTGKTVIAVQLLADALRLDLKAAHSTGGKAFTTVLRSKFKEASKLFIGNMSLRNAPTQSLDLLLVDEAHRIRETSDTRWTRKAERNKRSQMEELLAASKVTVFLLDDNQFIRPDEIGCTELIRNSCKEFKVPLREYDLATQFRCGGCGEYIDWVNYLLGFKDDPPRAWEKKYTFRLVDKPSQLEDFLFSPKHLNESNRMVGGFCWRWSDPRTDGSLVSDVKVGGWSRPWNAKRSSKKLYKPENDPYTLWAEKEEGRYQVGCIYSAQGFDFDRAGVIWGKDLVWREDQWVAVSENSYDTPVKSKKADTQRLLRNAYRILLTRGMLETNVLCLDKETRSHIKDVLKGCNDGKA
ncbi:DNA/RNA helicase domain-containing protein [Acidobacteriota bacterium]